VEKGGECQFSLDGATAADEETRCKNVCAVLYHKRGEFAFPMETRGTCEILLFGPARPLRDREPVPQ